MAGPPATSSSDARKESARSKPSSRNARQPRRASPHGVAMSADTRAKIDAVAIQQPTPQSADNSVPHVSEESTEPAGGQPQHAVPPSVPAPAPVKTPKRSFAGRSKSEGNLLSRSPRGGTPDDPLFEQAGNEPTTPAPRITLSQLLRGNDVTPVAGTESMVSPPDERIAWGMGTSRMPQGTPLRLKRAASPGSATRTGRRYRSNSPEGLPQTWKTSVADPATQLWSRYQSTVRPAGDRESDPSARLFKAPGVDRSPSLRRANSSDVSSKSRVKRRKTTGFEQLHDGDVVMGEVDPSAVAGPSSDPTRKARVNSLADKVKQKMKPPSSPLSNRGGSREETNPQQPTNGHGSSPIRAGAPPVALESSDAEEYGDLDFDMDEYDQLEAMATQGTQTPATSAPIAEIPAQTISSVGEEDEFGDLEDDDLEDMENMVSKYDGPSQVTSQQPMQATGTSGLVAEYGDMDLQAEDFSDDIAGKRNINRFCVSEVSDGIYEWKPKATRMQKILNVYSERSKKALRILLRDSWFRETMVSQGDYVNLIGSFDRYNTCIVDDTRNLLIVNPDILVSSTTVADTVKCMRLAVLRERVKAYGDISHSMLYGTILHAAFQMALEANDFSTPYLHKCIEKAIIQELQSLYVLKEKPDAATAHLQSKVPLLQAWAGIFVSAVPKASAKVVDHNSQNIPIVAIKKLLDVEEHIWSPMYGLKGNIDATVEATIIDNKRARTLTIPLELKTGRGRGMEHRAQTMLYTLLMADRYDLDVQCGLLYYMEHTEMIRVPAVHTELRSMIQNRNEAASYLRHRGSLPEVLGQAQACERCYAKEECFMYHKLLEDGTGQSSGLENDFARMTDHLGEVHKQFFRHWDGLLTKEESDSVRFRRELWTMLSSEREDVGRCFGNLVIVPGSQSTDKMGAKINKYTYTLRRQTASPSFTFLESQINTGEPIVISDEKGHYALAIGFATVITKTTITVAVDRRLHNARTRQRGFNEATNQVFNGLVELKSPSTQRNRIYEDDQVVYRLDKDEFGSGMARVRNNILQLLSAERDEKYRSLIVQLRAPVFKTESSAYQLKFTASQASLNEDQRMAIEKVMSAQDYALVLGMPGTGKTTTIAHIIRALVSQGKSILLTSYTHTAVDNILLKIRNDEMRILRLGVLAKIHPDVKEFATLGEAPKASFAEYEDAFHGSQIVATTCLGINHPIFQARKFDYCIVDEASQITLPVCVGPITHANTFILVGDHYQLPPLVRNKDAREGGLDVSLFKLLSDAHPQAVVNLAHQYRMCEEIMTLSNELIYNGMLKCGTEKVAKSALHIPRRKGLDRFHLGEQQCPKTCWIKDLLSENVKACFVDTDQVPAREVRQGDRTNNPVEAQLTFQLVEAFLSCGVDPNSIGVISVYRSQLKIIQHLLRGQPAVEMHTADKFQGRDKDVIIISLVRSNAENFVGELLRDWRRINVAFTRARTKLLILGSRSTLASNELLHKFVALMESRPNWLYTLPPDAHLAHSQAFQHVGGSENAGMKKTSSPKKVNGKARLLEKKLASGRSVLGDLVNHARG